MSHALSEPLPDDVLTAWAQETLSQHGLERPPFRLYKFLSPESPFFNANLSNAILESTLHLSTREVFNDPFDTTAACDPGTPDEQVLFLEELSRRRNDGLATDPATVRMMAKAFFAEGSFENMIQRNLDQIQICSLSAEVENLLMWAHYANCHRGVALIFNTATDAGSLGAAPVRYQQEFSRIQPSSKAIDEIMLYGPLYKGMDWFYEKEWRILAPMTSPNSHKFHWSMLWGVVFGMRCDKSIRSLVGHLCIERIQKYHLPPLHMYEARTRAGEFALDFYEIIPVERPDAIDFKKALPTPPLIVNSRQP